MSMVGKSYTEKAFYNVLDIDEFRVTAYNQGRVPKRESKVFDTFCVRLTIKRLKEYFN